jgi:hypothetical protein
MMDRLTVFYFWFVFLLVKLLTLHKNESKPLREFSYSVYTLVLTDKLQTVAHGC